MKIAFLHDWTMPLNEYLDNEDGLPEAIAVLARTHSVHWYTGGPGLTFPHRGYILSSVPTEQQLETSLQAQSPDIIICWGSLDRPWHKLIHDRFPRTPKVLCFAGGPTAHIARGYFRVIVCESQVYIDDFTRAGVTAVRGFGTNVRTFRPLGLPKVWNGIFPASLCFHKNIELFSRSLGGNGLCVGNHNEPTIVSKVLSLGTPLSHRVSSTVLCDLYNMSRITVITSGPHGGSQRAVLESMACGVPVIVMNDNDRCAEFVKESGFGRLCHPIEQDVRDTVDELLTDMPDKMDGPAYIRSKWTEDHYAKSLLDACSIAMAA